MRLRYYYLFIYLFVFISWTLKSFSNLFFLPKRFRNHKAQALIKANVTGQGFLPIAWNLPSNSWTWIFFFFFEGTIVMALWWSLKICYNWKTLFFSKNGSKFSSSGWKNLFLQKGEMDQVTATQEWTKEAFVFEKFL